MNFIKKTLLPLSFVFYTIFSGVASNAKTDYTLKTFTTAEGLADNWVQSICKDKTGFLWVATWDGLSRFDGYEFTNYNRMLSDSLSIPYFSLDKVVVDRFNTVMVFCQNKPLSTYNRALDRFEKLRVDGQVPLVADIRIDDKGNTWLLGTSCLYFSKGIENKFRRIKTVDAENKPILPGETSSLIAVDNKEGIWLYHMNPTGIAIERGQYINDSTVQFKPVQPINLKNYQSFALHTIDNIDISQSNSGKVWLFSKYGLFLFNQERNSFLPYDSIIAPEEFSGKPSFFWLDDQSGINIVDVKDKLHYAIPTEMGKYFETVFVDQKNIIWSGTISRNQDNIGLNRHIKIPGYFKNYLTGKNENGGLNLIGPIVKDRFGDIWAGAKDLQYIYRINQVGEINKVPYPARKLNSIFPSAVSMIQDSNGIWLACKNDQLLLRRHGSGRWETVITSAFMMDGKPGISGIHNVLKRRNTLIINGFEGIYELDPERRKITLCTEYSPTILNGTGFTMCDDGKGGIWIGSLETKLIHANSSMKIDTCLKFENRDDIIEHICPGDSNDVWVALQGGGLGHLYQSSKKNEILTTLDGLASNTLHSILKDRKGRLWISTSKGISCYDPKLRHFRNFGLEDGLKMEEFIDDSYFQTKDGEMFFGGMGGMVGFYPDSIPPEEEAKWPLVITNLNVSGIPRNFNKALYELNGICLEKGDDNFQVSFACLNFLDYRNINYRYRLRGVSDIWRTTNHKNKMISFFNLHPGKYQLEIEASHRSDKWESKTSLEIEIPFRMYEMLWFRILLAMVVLLIPVSWVILYFRDIRLRSKLDQEEMRMQVLRSQMNPHFIFNALNSINFFISKNDKLSANNYIADFSRLIRSFLNNLSYDFIPLEDEFQLLKDYLRLEHLRFGDKFDYSFETPEIDDNLNCYVLSGIVQPFIENAIWHGMNGLEERIGHIGIRFHFVHPTAIRCVIEDDGIGRALAGIYRHNLPHNKSCGTDIVLERLHFYNLHKHTNCQLVIEDLYPDRMETGTRVTVDIPIKKGDPHTSKPRTG